MTTKHIHFDLLYFILLSLILFSFICFILFYFILIVFSHHLQVIKTFLRERGLNNTYTGGLSSYCLVLMIISFLHHHYLSHPPLPLGAPAIETNNWGILLLGFLNFYGKDFDYQHTGISITPGRSTFPLTLSPAPHSFPSYHQPFHHLPPHIHTSIDIQEDALHIPAYTAHALAQPSYAHTFLSHPPLDNPTEFSVFPDTLQFPLESPLPPLPTQEPTQFTTAPHIFIEDPIRKGVFHFFCSDSNLRAYFSFYFF